MYAIRSYYAEAWFDIRAFDKFLKRDSLHYERRILIGVLQDLGCSYKQNGTTVAGKSCRPWIAFPKELEKDEKRYDNEEA